MKMKRGISALITVFFFFSLLSVVYLFKPLGLKDLTSIPVLKEQIKLEPSSENGADIKALKAILNFAKRYLPIS